MSEARDGAAWQRLHGLVRKEMWQILRDPSSLSIAFVLPLALLFLFGYGVSLDARNLRIALLVEQPSQEASELLVSFINSDYFLPVVVRSRQQAERLMAEGQVQGIFALPPRFAADLPQGQATLQLIVDGADANAARSLLGYTRNVYADWLALRALESAQPPPPGAAPRPRIWFNPEVRSQNFLVPGLIAIIMTLTGALLTALLVAREYDRGTIEALMVTPATRSEILLGKLIPTFILGMGGMFLSVAMAVWLFDIPFRGSFAVLVLVSALFMLVTLGMGLLISTFAKTQFVAGQIAIMVTFLPAFILSDFIFNLASAPDWVQAVSYVVAARYFIAILKTLFLAGDVWAVILPNAAALGAMAVLFLGLSWALTHKRLE